MRAVVYSKQLDKPISTKSVDKSDMTSELILTEVEKVMQSKTDFCIDEGFFVEMITVQRPEEGSGGVGKRFYTTTSQFVRGKKSVISIQNNDELCCARAIVVAKAKIDKHPEWNNIRQGRKKQTELAEALHEQAGVAKGPCGLEEIKAFQSFLTGYQIIVVSQSQLNEIVYRGPLNEKKLILYLCKDQTSEPGGATNKKSHYHVITSMSGFLEQNCFCWICERGYSDVRKHKCENVCKTCEGRGCAPFDDSRFDWQHCDKCNRFFRSKMCLHNHTLPNKNGVTVCERKVRCENCSQTYLREDSHVCWTHKCKHCSEMVDSTHLCFMQPIPLKRGSSEENDLEKELLQEGSFVETFDDDEIELIEITEVPDDVPRAKSDKKAKHGKKNQTAEQEVTENTKRPMFFFDYECCQDTGVHVPICAVVRQASTNKAYVFKGADTATLFGKWIFREEHRHALFFAHNLAGYDGHFIMKYLLDQAIKPSVIRSGGKIMAIEVPKLNIKFIDSYNFLPMKLAQLPKTFDFEDKTKGWFPHFFSSLDRMDYVGSLPDAKFYGVDNMSTEERAKCSEWIRSKQEEGYVFDFAKDLVDYCFIDVRILEQGVLTFKEIFEQVSTGIDPFENSITIASACNVVFRTLFLKEKTIGIVPVNGSRQRDKQSRDAVEWMNFVAHKEGVQIKHAKNSNGEKRVCGLKVDGFDEASNTVYEYHGCFYHGCPKCYQSNVENSVNRRQMWELYAETDRKRRLIKNNGYGYVELWGHEFEEIRKGDDYKACRASTSQPYETPCDRDNVPYMDPRDAFFGGRTNASTLYAEAMPGSWIYYDDFTSQYPFVNKNTLYPVGHPEVIVDGFSDDISDYFGVAKCRVLPPRRLRHPVLPERVNGKLMFHLCETCATTQQRRCDHSDFERSFVGTWSTIELEKAVEKGYRIVQFYEVHHFDVRSAVLFKEYIDMWLKIKQEASGWPEWVLKAENRPAAEDEYIRKYLENEGILLDREKIKVNKGMRALAKLMLNSFWGKFGQRDNLTKTEYVTSPARFFDLVFSDEVEVSSITIHSDEIVEVQHRATHMFVPESPNTNIYIALFTTARARQ
ncbi:uncharacterized protein LOC144862027 [Branchiostoma floridae x Branchiostoma japonicum]